jgi:hypothetical protein
MHTISARRKSARHNLKAQARGVAVNIHTATVRAARVKQRSGSVCLRQGFRILIATRGIASGQQGQRRARN